MIELTLEMAEKIALAARDKAKELGITITLSVVDEAGRLILTQRGTGNGFLSTEIAQAKASASAAFKRSTKELFESREANTVFWNTVPTVVSQPVMLTTGGVPVSYNGKVIGGIGIGGGSAEQDHQCALAGVESIKQ